MTRTSSSSSSFLLRSGSSLLLFLLLLVSPYQSSVCSGSAPREATTTAASRTSFFVHSFVPHPSPKAMPHSAFFLSKLQTTTTLSTGAGPGGCTTKKQRTGGMFMGGPVFPNTKAKANTGPFGNTERKSHQSQGRSSGSRSSSSFRSTSSLSRFSRNPNDFNVLLLVA